MRRIEIKEGVRDVLDALSRSGVQEQISAAFDGTRRGQSGDFSIEMLGALKVYGLLASGFNEAAHQAAEIMELDMLEKPSVWASLCSGEPPALHQAHYCIQFARDHLPKLLEFLSQKGHEDYITVIERGSPPEQGFETLTILILEDETQFSRPQRLIEVLEAAQLLYGHCAPLFGVSADRFTVLSCDSGSDKSFDFLGLAKVVQQVKEIILGLWDKVVYLKEKSFVAKMDSLSSGLAVFSKVTEMEATGDLGREEAEIIRRGIMDGCQKFLSAGAIIPEIAHHARHEPRTLMAPEVKLLMAPKDAHKPSSSHPSTAPTRSGELPEDPEMYEKFKAFMAQQGTGKQSVGPTTAPSKPTKAKKPPRRPSAGRGDASSDQKV